MFVDNTVDFSPSYIEIKKLVRQLEVDFNERNYKECLEKATELCLYAREMKTNLHLMLESKTKGD
jgi:hypothetical protein